MADREETLRRLTLGDDAYLDALRGERQSARRTRASTGSGRRS